MKKPRYEIRRGYRAPTPSDPSSPDTATHEVWKCGTWAHGEALVDVFTIQAHAQRCCDVLNGLGRGSK